MNPVIESQRAIVAEHIRYENAHQWNDVYETFVQDERAFYEVMPLGAKLSGIEGVRNFYGAISAAFPDLHIEVVSEYDVPGCSIREVIVSGTHTGEYMGLKPLGNKARIPLAAFYLFNEDATKLVAERIYYDQAGLAAQLQARQTARSA